MIWFLLLMALTVVFGIMLVRAESSGEEVKKNVSFWGLIVSKIVLVILVDIAYITTFSTFFFWVLLIAQIVLLIRFLFTIIRTFAF